MSIRKFREMLEAEPIVPIEEFKSNIAFRMVGDNKLYETVGGVEFKGYPRVVISFIPSISSGRGEAKLNRNVFKTIKKTDRPNRIEKVADVDINLDDLDDELDELFKPKVNRIRSKHHFE